MMIIPIKSNKVQWAKKEDQEQTKHVKVETLSCFKPFTIAALGDLELKIPE